MNLIDLASTEERVRDFILGAALHSGGSIIQYHGQTVAVVVPASDEVNGDAPWTEEKNQRRGDLIDKKYATGLTLAETIELARLQEQAGRERQRLSPLPLAEVRRLHQELLAKVAAASTKNP